MTPNIRAKQAEQRAEGATLTGLALTISGDEPEFAADLRAIWPTLPPEWHHVETYCAVAFMGDPDVQMFQVWLCGETGELLMQLTIATQDTPLLHVMFKPAPEIEGVRLYPDGEGLTEADRDRALDAINTLHLRHNVPAPGVH